MLGNWQPALPNPPNTATSEIQQMVVKLKPQLQEKLDMDLGQCQALFYYSQMVEGVSYLILVSYNKITNLMYCTCVYCRLRCMYLGTHTHKTCPKHLYSLVPNPSPSPIAAH